MSAAQTVPECQLSLCQLENRARQNQFVRPVALPRTQARLSPGALCTVAGWGLISRNRSTDTLRDVRLRVQMDRECSRRFRNYTGQTQICVGDRRERKSAFSVRPQASANTAPDIGAWAKLDSGNSLHPTSSVWGPDQSMVGASSHQSSLWKDEKSTRNTMHTYAVFSPERLRCLDWVGLETVTIAKLKAE